MATPALGRAIRAEWRLDPDFLVVNHGSFGATPLCVRAAQDEWRQQMEARPSWFMARVVPGALIAARESLAAFTGARADDLAFVDNATAGCNAVLRSLEFGPGDEILVLDLGYGAVRNTVRYVAERTGARMTEARLPFPDVTGAGVVAAVQNAVTDRTRIAVIDHITSSSGLVLPVAGIIGVCHDANVPVLVDGAHGPGQVGLDLTALGADWYTGNCHKWLCAPKGCAFLWTSPNHRDRMHPTIISHGYGQGYNKEFDWTGTRDPSAWLSVSAAIAFHERLGGAALRARNTKLAAEAASLIARRLNSETGPEAAAMRLVRLGPGDAPSALALRARLFDAGTDAPVNAIGGSLWLRVSAFAYNELDDYARLAEIVARAIGPR